jgi:hypothetical protein
MTKAAAKKRDQRQRKRLGQVVLQVPIYDLVAFLDQLILEGRLDEEDSDNWSAICKATGGLLYRYYRQRETIVPRDPSELVYGPRYGAAFIDQRTGLLQRQKPPKEDEPWELIKKEIEAEREEYLVVLSDEAAEIAEFNCSSFGEPAEPEDQLGDKLDEADNFTDDCEPDPEDLPDEFD